MAYYLFCNTESGIVEEEAAVVKNYVFAVIRLGSKGGVFRYKTRIHKVLFILVQEFKEFDWLRSDFVLGHFGPWSYEVESIIIALTHLGFLEEKVVKLDEIDG